MEEENKEDVSVPDDGDLSHVSAATRVRMQRVQELEAQRLQRVLERSRPPQVSADNVPAAGSRSPLLGRVGRAESIDSTSAVGDGIPGDNKFLKRLHELVETAENEETRARYIRLIELENQRLQHKPEPNRGTRLSRSSSMNERSVRERYTRRNSDQVNQTRVNRISSPVSVRRNLYTGATSDSAAAAAALPHASSLSSILDSTAAMSEKLFINKQEEGKKKLEELQKKRQEGLRSSSTEDVRDTSGYRGAIFQSAPIPLETRSTFPLTRRIPETTGQYSSIQELHEPMDNLQKYSSDTSIDNLPAARETRRFSIDAPSPVREEVSESAATDYVPYYVNGSIQGTTFVNEEGITQWLTPASPNYVKVSQYEQFEQNRQKMKEAAERKKRSILAKEGLGDHSLAECFDPDYTFEERIAAIREKLYGSKVLIPSDKRQNSASGGSPDGAAQAKGSGKSCSER